jgi:redox-sensitive bicupin YhaK (pirin superfamily)
VTLASGREGDADALPIDQDAALLGATLAAGQSALHSLGPDRQAYLVAARGRIKVNGKEAQARDGIVVRGEGTIAIEALDDAEILLADLP